VIVAGVGGEYGLTGYFVTAVLTGHKCCLRCTSKGPMCLFVRRGEKLKSSLMLAL
jgi:hypothetical protein